MCKHWNNAPYIFVKRLKKLHVESLRRLLDSIVIRVDVSFFLSSNYSIDAFIMCFVMPKNIRVRDKRLLFFFLSLSFLICISVGSLQKFTGDWCASIQFQTHNTILFTCVVCRYSLFWYLFYSYSKCDTCKYGSTHENYTYFTTIT